jgi:hypothetical protein
LSRPKSYAPSKSASFASSPGDSAPGRIRGGVWTGGNRKPRHEGPVLREIAVQGFAASSQRFIVVICQMLNC